ncbi:iron permease [Mycena albidolilacea]|uniref:Iron permease n=1 Tax=Mycena albidolilacea TaxID=1033008 RepID=A0AAD7ERD1_9AGAR|nr:iron permease [Mycena albidolilacea]
MQDTPLEIEAQRPLNSASAPKSRAFWMSYLAIMVSVFLSALDLTAIATPLPTIASALNDTKGDYIWVGSAYALSSTAFIPLSGNLADVFGRKPIMLLSIAFFAVGSALAGASQNMAKALIESVPLFVTTVTGIGGGGIVTLTQIITSDLVPLAERGKYQGLIGMIWCLASFIGPPIGGALASQGNKAWRWLFYLNLPLAGIAFTLVVRYLSVNHPEGSIRHKLAQVDWLGNAIVIAGTGLAIIGLTWGGVRYPWASVEVLAPLVIGLSLLVVFAVYEAKVPVRPAIPLDVLGNRTSVSGQVLLTDAVHGITSISTIYYLPVFFQACFGASPIRSAVNSLPGSLITTPFALSAGVLITIMGKYRPINWIGWVISIVGFGLVSTFREDSSVGKWVGYQLVGGIGLGLLFSAPIFPLLAPLPPTRAGSALALFSFVRAFSQTWGITISSTILQNSLKKNLPPTFVAQFPPGFEIAYAAIPVIRQLEPPLRNEVRAAFADSMAVIWQTMIGIAGLGLLLSLLMKEVPMGTTVDKTYTLKEKEKTAKSKDIENGE